MRQLGPCLEGCCCSASFSTVSKYIKGSFWPMILSAGKTEQPPDSSHMLLQLVIEKQKRNES